MTVQNERSASSFEAKLRWAAAAGGGGGSFVSGG
jgi:hypothetical protein